MITNGSITYYKKVFNPITKLEEWQKYYFDNVWKFAGKGSSINNGYENSNNINIRIPMHYVTDATIFAIGDIIAIGKQADITKQEDLQGKEFYNVTAININEFGNNPHIHLGGK